MPAQLQRRCAALWQTTPHVGTQQMPRQACNRHDLLVTVLPLLLSDATPEMCTAGVPRGSLVSMSNDADLSPAMVAPPGRSAGCAGLRQGPRSSSAAHVPEQSAPASPRAGVPLQEPLRHGGPSEVRAPWAAVDSAAAAPPAGPGEAASTMDTAGAAAAPQVDIVQPPQPEPALAPVMAGAQSAQQAAKGPGTAASMQAGGCAGKHVPISKVERPKRTCAASGSGSAAPATSKSAPHGSADPTAGAGAGHGQAAAKPKPWRGGCAAAPGPAAGRGKAAEAASMAARRRQAALDYGRQGRQRVAANAAKRAQAAGADGGGGAGPVPSTPQPVPSVAEDTAAELRRKRLTGGKRRVRAVRKETEEAEGGGRGKRQRTDPAPAAASRPKVKKVAAKPRPAWRCGAARGSAAVTGGACGASAKDATKESAPPALRGSQQSQQRVAEAAAKLAGHAAGAAPVGASKAASGMAKRVRPPAGGDAVKVDGKLAGGKRRAADLPDAEGGVGHTPSKRHCGAGR